MKPSFTDYFRDKLKKQNQSLYNALVATEDRLPALWERCSPGTYTSHGKPHIESVEYYVDKLIGEERLNYISAEEYFILLMGAFCHDIGMMTGRELHNLFSYKFVINEEINRDIIVPDSNYYKPIAMLCLGHRDYEDENGREIHTLTDSCRIDDEDVKFEKGKIKINHSDAHLQYLAAILRLADELDVTDIRTPQNVFRYYESINGMPADVKEHWQKGSIIKDVDVFSNGSATSIRLVPNIENIRKLAGNDAVLKERYLRIVFSVKDKIEKEIERINIITFNDTSIVDDRIAVRFDVDINYDNDFITKDDYEEYKRAIEKKQREQIRTNLDKSIDTTDSHNNGQERKELPRITLNRKIYEFRRDKNLLETGRFMYSFGKRNDNKEKEEENKDEEKKDKENKENNEYTQYFINTPLLLTNRESLDSITELFKEQFEDKGIDCVIGIGKAGIILAPNLALKLNCNSSYIICDWEGTSSIPQEEATTVIKDAKNILVLLDVISTGTATRHGIEKIKTINGTTLEKIYIGTIFCTNIAIKENLEKDDRVQEMYYIYDDFQFKTFSYQEYMDDKNEEFRKGLELLPLRKK